MNRFCHSLIAVLHFVFFSPCRDETIETKLEFAPNSPRIISKTQAAASLSMEVNKGCNVYHIVQATGLPEPNASMVKQGKNGKGETAYFQGSKSLSSRTPQTIMVDLMPYQDNVLFLTCETEAGESLNQELNLTNMISAVNDVAKTHSNLYVVLVHKDEDLIFENYYSGRIEDQLNGMKSVSKGVMSLVTGKAIELGYLKLETTLGDVLPGKYQDILDDVKKSITVRQLLTMSSGLGGLET